MLNDLAIRAASAVALGVPFVLSVRAGAPYFDLWIVAAIIVLAWEWYRLTASPVGSQTGTFGPRGLLFVICALLPVLAASLLSPPVALVVAAAAILGMLVSAQGPAQSNAWLSGGIAYLTLPCIALLWLRHDAPDGLAVVFWLIAVVWASDIGAYFAGRLIGGPKLAPAISPNKTWAGFFGGCGAAMMVGAIATVLTGADSLLAMAAVSVGLGIVAQLGDLVESWLKRRFGAKDTSALIPGHGGLLDRVDGLMAAAALLALIDAAHEGSMFLWL